MAAKKKQGVGNEECKGELIGNRSGVRIPNESAFNNSLENQRKFVRHARSALYFNKLAGSLFPFLSALLSDAQI